VLLVPAQARGERVTGLEPLLDQQSESDWQQQVLEWARRGGFRAYHTRDSRRSSAGFPDLVLVHPGRHLLLFAELKRNTGLLTTAQLEWLGSLSTVEHVGVEIWRPHDWQRVKAVLLGSQEVGRAD